MRLIDADEITATLEIAISMMENTKSIIGVENLPVIDVEIKAYTDILKGIKEQPTIQPERKKGEWLPDNNNAYEMRFVCSCCKESEVVPTIGFTKYKPLWDFCPNCGADMRGERDG